jgi:hypothetical protein
VAAAVVRVVEQEGVALPRVGEGLGTARAAQGMAPTWTGMWSACATNRHPASHKAMEKSREELRICE